MSPIKSISVIIPTYNKASRLRLVLLSLLNLVCEIPTEVIVVNDGSTDETGDMLTKFEMQYRSSVPFDLRVIHTENQGRSAARNIGWQSASGDLIVFTDDDLILHPQFIQAHQNAHNWNNTLVHGCIKDLPFVKFFKDPATGDFWEGGRGKEGLRQHLVTPEIVLHNQDFIERSARLTKFEKHIHELLLRVHHDFHAEVCWVCCTGGNFSILKRHLSEVGGFDINLGKKWGCEDLELGYRLSKTGVGFTLCMNAVNYHLSHFRHTTKEEHEIAFRYFYNKYRDEKIRYLYNYFEGEIPTLIDWATQCGVEVM